MEGWDGGKERVREQYSEARMEGGREGGGKAGVRELHVQLYIGREGVLVHVLQQHQPASPPGSPFQLKLKCDF